MDSKDDVTLQVLIDIRDEIRGTNKRVDTLTGRVDHLTERVDHLTGRVDHLTDRVDNLETRMTQSEIRIATALTDVAGSVNDVKHMLQNQLDLRDRVGKCEQDIAELKRRTKGDN